METQVPHMGKKRSNYDVIAKEEFEEIFSFPTQLHPLDFSGFSRVCTAWDLPRDFGMQETTHVLDAFPFAAEMSPLSNSSYSSFDLEHCYTLPQDDLLSDTGSALGVWEELGKAFEIQQQQQQQLVLGNTSNDTGKQMAKVDQNEQQMDVRNKLVRKSSREAVKNTITSKVLTRKTISQYFYMPITQAARELNVGLTLLKKKCRELGILRWPHRKLMSLQTLIQNVQEMGKDKGQGKFREVIEILEKEKKLLEQAPDMQLENETKRLRQACFKANYKKRKLMGLVDSSSSINPAGADHETAVNFSNETDDEDDELKCLFMECFPSSFCDDIMI